MRIAGLVLPLAACTVVLCSFACGDALHQDELDCEEAVSHLEACCPGFVASSNLRCIYDDPGCGTVTEPAIPEDAAGCIRNKSCDTVVQDGVCAAIASAQAKLGPNGVLPSGVCQ